VKSVCRQKLFDSCVDDVIQLITEYLPPFDPNGPFVLVTLSGRPYNICIKGYCMLLVILLIVITPTSIAGDYDGEYNE